MQCVYCCCWFISRAVRECRFRWIVFFFSRYLRGATPAKHLTYGKRGQFERAPRKTKQGGGAVSSTGTRPRADAVEVNRRTLGFRETKTDATLDTSIRAHGRFGCRFFSATCDANQKMSVCCCPPPSRPRPLPLSFPRTAHRRPWLGQVVDYEYKVLLSRGFDLEAVHPTEHISAFLLLTGAPFQVRACFAWLVSPCCLFWPLLYINSSGGCVFFFRAIPFLSLETARVNPPCMHEARDWAVWPSCIGSLPVLVLVYAHVLGSLPVVFLMVNPLCLRLWFLPDPASRGSAPGSSFFSLALPVLSFSSEPTPDLAIAPALCIGHKSSRTGSHNSSLSCYFSVFLSSVFAGHFLPVSCPYRTCRAAAAGVTSGVVV